MARKSRQRQRRTRSSETHGLLWLAVVVFFVMLSGLAVLFVWERIQLQKIGRDIVELERVKVVLDEDLARQRGQVEALSSYTRISRIAATRFRFVPLKPKLVYMQVPDEKSRQP